jgi:hypothetical protein
VKEDKNLKSGRLIDSEVIRRHESHHLLALVMFCLRWRGIESNKSSMKTFFGFFLLFKFIVIPMPRGNKNSMNMSTNLKMKNCNI